MEISSRYTLAIHIVTCTDFSKEDYKIISDFGCNL